MLYQKSVFPLLLLISITLPSVALADVTIDNRYICDTSGESYRLRDISSQGLLRFGAVLRSIRRNELRPLRVARRNSFTDDEFDSYTSQIQALRQDLIRPIRECRNETIDDSDDDSGGGDNNTGACEVAGGNASSNATIRIINGSVCTTGDSGVLYLELYNGNSFEGSCTGTAVNDHQIVTAAHCVEGITSIDVYANGDVITATDLVAHPSYDQNNFNDPAEYYDIAVVTTPQAMSVQTFPILTEDNLEVGETAVIAGFGINDTEGAFDDKLRAGFVDLNSVDGLSIETLYDGSLSNTCNGDSGGPLFVERDGVWKLAGVTSNGVMQNCGSGDQSYYGNITFGAHKSFLEQQID